MLQNAHLRLCISQTGAQEVRSALQHADFLCQPKLGEAQVFHLRIPGGKLLPKLQLHFVLVSHVQIEA